ncbi:MAG: hypothetical protein PVI51_05280 [candidate division WOR-3 bacterium]
MSVSIITVAILAQINIGGYVETRPYITWSDSTYFTGYNRGWLEFKSEAENYGMQLALDLIVPYDTISLNYARDNIDISRLALWLGREQARIVIGKQSLYWGVGRVFRPLDVFNRINYFEPGFERPGSNALLGYLALGSLSNIRGILIPHGDVKKTLAGMRAGTNILKNDIGITAMHQSSEKRTIIGGEIAGELVLGYWIEGAFSWEDTVNYSRITIGLDYTFPYMIYTLLEYYFDGSGQDDPANYEYAKIISGERQTLAQQYIYTSIGLLYNPFLRPSISAIINLDDDGLIIIPSINYAIFENTELTLGMNYAIGSEQSEFRNLTEYRGAVYLWVKTYF